MKTVERKLSELRVYENNPRQNEKAVEAVQNSIIKYGYKVPIVIDNDNIIVCGHTRFQALLNLHESRGYSDTIVCILADDLTDEQIREFRIVDNLTAENAEWDITKLKIELEVLNNLDLNLFGEIPALTFEEIQIQEESKIELNDKVYIKVGTETIEMTEIEFNEWTAYVIDRYNMSISDFVKQKLELRVSDRNFEILEI